ncbi:aldehyde dehydrogenase family protein [Shinella sp. 838]|jgi:aldehyde dehydrogenase (NAD+)|uniref:L-piperidine-6-carboxylate dehydrogenase n=1 Tax=unclassified Shinella TaxID=2643062 RepID=UPI0003C53BAA|nr:MULTISPECIES: aldehyde dehydrogenase family protein [unclassified Shinella]EYR78973.1 NAD-dependent aldehyde dehydrogenase [Shinella sp. DD12]MCA0341422.1 aldehyde dehydrogenase family protein [Pseudomonadota bacterium]MDG4673796.1 aldehyde dehydrogenase family protein [Shinella sp. 838]
MTNVDVKQETAALLDKLGVARSAWQGGDMASYSPVSGEEIGKLKTVSATDTNKAIDAAHDAFKAWRLVPAPKRGELVRLLGEELRASKADLGRLVSIEAGKITSEGLGEVQEMIDICDFAVGLSRQLYGLTIATERPGHRMMETWHPLGVVGIISAFNFPVAVWSWNAALALVAGNSIVWKPSEKTPLTALACQAIFERALARFGDAPANLSIVLIGDRTIGEALVDNHKVALVSATGSTRMGKEVGPRLAKRFARSILELGGNNAGIVCPSADLDMALRAIAFGAMGTAGQRCTTLRRLFVHDSVYDQLVPRLKKAYTSVSVGNPLETSALVGPLVDKQAFDGMQKALAAAKAEGGSVTGGERVADAGKDTAYYVKPAIVEMPKQAGPVLEETFAPILYVMKYSDFDAVLDDHNAVAAGLSSSIFTLNVQEAERFLSVDGSDCGIANVNIGTSGAEIGGAFGGEKETGGGRESGSDAWKAYMRRATNTVNYSKALPLAQGVSFDIE